MALSHPTKHSSIFFWWANWVVYSQVAQILSWIYHNQKKFRTEVLQNRSYRKGSISLDKKQLFKVNSIVCSILLFSHIYPKNLHLSISNKIDDNKPSKILFCRSTRSLRSSSFTSKCWTNISLSPPLLILSSAPLSLL